MAPKRAIPSSSNSPVTKKVKLNREDEIAAEEEITPIQKLYDSLSVAGKVKALPVKKDSVVVYWMRLVRKIIDSS